jgi:FeS assembly SUF system protein
MPLPRDDDKDLFDFMPGASGGSPADGGDVQRPEPGDLDEALQERVIEAIKTVYDPEIPVNIVDLGLVYELLAKRDGTVYVEMTLTTPHCPVAGSMPGKVEEAIRTVDGVKDARVKLVWTPPWTQERMTEEAKLELGLL